MQSSEINLEISFLKNTRELISYESITRGQVILIRERRFENPTTKVYMVANIDENEECELQN
jgi:hypothetical protein